MPVLNTTFCLRNLLTWSALALTVICALTPSARADRLVTSTEIQNGGTLTIVPGFGLGALVVSGDPENSAALTMTNGAVSNYANKLTSVVVGNLNGEAGSLLIEDASVVSTVGAPFYPIGTYGSVSVYHGGSYIGLNTGSTGQATVTGAGSQWNTAQVLTVGFSGSGTLEVSSGGSVSSNSYIIGRQDGSTGSITVTGAGSSMTGGDLGYFDVGSRGDGTLNIRNGGTVRNAIATVGDQGGTGTVSVTGTGSQWINTRDLYLGGDNSVADETASGSVTVGNGGLVQVSGTTLVHEGGEIILNSDGTLETESLTADGPGDVEFNGGELRLTGGTLNLNGDVAIISGSTLSGVGTVEGNVKNVEGTVGPGQSPGVLAITGDFTQSEPGILDIGIAGLLAGAEYDVLDVSGTVTLDGVIRVSLDGYAPVWGDSFQILEFGSLVDNGFSFDLSSALLDDGLSWNTDEFFSSGTLAVVPEPSPASLLAGTLLAGTLLSLLARRSRRA